MTKQKMTSNERNNLIKYVVPAALANTCFFLFSVVDGIFVGRGVGTQALGAVNLALPFVLIAEALNSLVTIGGVTIVAIRLGRGDKEGAESAFMHSFLVILLVGILITIGGTCFTRPAVRLLGARESYAALVEEYLFWWAIFGIPSSLNVNLMGFCRNDGSSGRVAVGTGVATALNIFLDWLFVFPLHMGLMGAAVATGISQTVSLFIIMSHFLMKQGSLSFQLVPISFKLFRKIAFRGLPEAIAQISPPVTTLCTNYVLLAGYGDIGINAYSVISYVSSFTQAIFFGASEGLQPLFGQSYGAKEERDLKFYLRAGIYISGVGSLICFAGYLFLGSHLCRLFGADPETTGFAVEQMWKCCWGLIIASINTLLSAYFYSTKRSREAIILNVSRGLIVNTAIILILPRILGRGVIWHTLGIYELIVLAIAIGLLKISERNGITYK